MFVSIGARQISEAMVQLSEATRATAETQREAARVMQSLDQAARVLHREVSLFKVDNNRAVEPQRPHESALAVAAL